MEGIDQQVDSARGLSLLQDAEQRRAEREHSLFLDVPTWNGDLIAEYRVPSPDNLRKLAEAAIRRVRSNNGKNEPGANDVSLIAAANVGLYMKDPETEDRVPIEDEVGHVGYDRIATTLGKDGELQSQFDVIRYMMAERNDDGTYTQNVLAISMHANAIQRWMRDTSKRGVDLEDLLGEL